MSRLRLVSLLAVALCAATWHTPAWAISECEDTKKLGDRAMDDSRYSDALAAYKKSYECNGEPSLLYNRARALEALGQFPESLKLLLQFQNAAPESLLKRVPGLSDLVAETRNKVTTLDIRCNVEGAEVRTRDQVVGTVPFAERVLINAGGATIQVALDGYLPWEQHLDLPGGGQVVLDVKLHTNDKDGMLVVESPASGSQVFIDDKLVGTVPTETRVSPGPHQVVVTHSGYSDAEESVVVPAGTRKSLVMKMVESSFLSSWWFWGGVVGVVAGGAAAGYMLFPEAEEAGRGDIAPGQIEAPLMVQF
ncbi:MAG: PEGA domain-containing protein [Polyangiaceae bacterium]|nr:PEGA domain-containing protein [Polyangiaceae bacterium]